MINSQNDLTEKQSDFDWDKMSVQSGELFEEGKDDIILAG